jgi:hypothetical protein
MTQNPDRSTHSNPQPSDAVLGGQNPAPQQGAILGGIDRIKQLLDRDDVELRLEALKQALSYGNVGRSYIEAALGDRSKTVRRQARWLLRQPQGTGTLVPALPLWNLTERFIRFPAYINRHVTHFANRKVQEFPTTQPASDIQNVAYALRCDNYENQLAWDLEELVNEVGGDRVEALVFGYWAIEDDVRYEDSSELVELLVEWSDRLPNLKALFIGDITSEESDIFWIKQSDLSPILPAYPRLEILQVRGGKALKFSPVATIGDTARHDSLRALIVETGGLNRSTLDQICSWDFPALEHLELWCGTHMSGLECSGEDFSPILEDLKFPKLTYLGLRNSQVTDEIVRDLVRSPILAGLQVLDLSLGNLSDEGAAKLLECPAIRDLETLNVSNSYLSGVSIYELRSLGIEVLADNQQYEDRRYSTAGE